MRSSHEMLGWPLAAKRFAQNVLPEPDMPTRAIRNGGGGWLAMGSFQYDIVWFVCGQVFPVKDVPSAEPASCGWTCFSFTSRKCWNEIVGNIFYP
jgi:hypothetical protein